MIHSFCCPAHSNPCLRMGRGRRSRPVALSIPRVLLLLAEGRRGHGNATAVRSQSEPAADGDCRAANNVPCVYERARPRGALPLCRRLGRRRAAARRLASCSTAGPGGRFPRVKSTSRPEEMELADFETSSWELVASCKSATQEKKCLMGHFALPLVNEKTRIENSPHANGPFSMAFWSYGALEAQ